MGTWSSVAVGRRKSPGPKGFPISLNGTLIVIPTDRGAERSRVEERNGRAAYPPSLSFLSPLSLKRDNSYDRQFSIGEHETPIASTKLFRIPVIDTTPSFARAPFNLEVCAPRRSYYEDGAYEGTFLPRNLASRSSMKLKMFTSGSWPRARTGRSPGLPGVNPSLMRRSFNWYIM